LSVGVLYSSIKVGRLLSFLFLCSFAKERHIDNKEAYVGHELHNKALPKLPSFSTNFTFRINSDNNLFVYLGADQLKSTHIYWMLPIVKLCSVSKFGQCHHLIGLGFASPIAFNSYSQLVSTCSNRRVFFLFFNKKVKLAFVILGVFWVFDHLLMFLF
jgi:hypothetical protein